jgi:hypothetical protein
MISKYLVPTAPGEMTWTLHKLIQLVDSKPPAPEKDKLLRLTGLGSLIGPVLLLVSMRQTRQYLPQMGCCRGHHQATSH